MDNVAISMENRGPVSAAAQLLLDIAGEAHEHVRMSGGLAKYYTVYRSLTVDVDARLAEQLEASALARLRASTTMGHLLGVTTVGAWLWRQNAYARALCFDADDRPGWRLLIVSARRLAQAGYLPLLESSPAGRGGHLWLIYTHLVDVYAALAQVRSLAPDLARLSEWWPRPGPRPTGNKIRLPAGRYLAPDLSRWCKLYDIHGVELSEDGRSAAPVLLTMQTPGELVPALSETARAALEQELTSAQTQPAAHPERPGLKLEPVQAGPDAHWQAKYGSGEGRKLWFAFSEDQLVARFNEKHQVRDLLPKEANGYGLASWRDERTASVGLFEKENAWIDFGAGARRGNGRQDGGDALELYVRRSSRSKSEILRELARDLNREARAALEDAAQAGDGPPGWVRALLTESGWHYYQTLRGRFQGQEPGA